MYLPGCARLEVQKPGSQAVRSLECRSAACLLNFSFKFKEEYLLLIKFCSSPYADGDSRGLGKQLVINTKLNIEKIVKIIWLPA